MHGAKAYSIVVLHVQWQCKVQPMPNINYKYIHYKSSKIKLKNKTTYQKYHPMQ